MASLLTPNLPARSHSDARWLLQLYPSGPGSPPRAGRFPNRSVRLMPVIRERRGVGSTTRSVRKNTPQGAFQTYRTGNLCSGVGDCPRP